MIFQSVILNNGNSTAPQELHQHIYHVAYSILGVYMYMTCVLVVTASWRSLDFKVWTALCHAIAGWMIRTDSHMMDFVAFHKLTADETLYHCQLSLLWEGQIEQALIIKW